MPQALEAALLALASGFLGFLIAHHFIPRSRIMAAIDDLKAAATAIVANQATLVKQNSDLLAENADLKAKLSVVDGDAVAALAAEDAAVAEVAAQLTAAVQPAPAA